MIIVSDTSPIANLLQIRRLDLLQQLFGKILIPPSVHKEIKRLENFSIDLTAYYNATWIEIIAPINEAKVLEFMLEIDEGESEAIVLAKEHQADYLLIDERLGTSIALTEGLQTIGLIGVLIKAKEIGLITAIQPILNDLENKAGFWISKKLKNIILKDLGEI